MDDAAHLPPRPAQRKRQHDPERGEDAAHADRLHGRHGLGGELDQGIVEDEDEDSRRHREDAAGVVDHVSITWFRTSSG